MRNTGRRLRVAGNVTIPSPGLCSNIESFWVSSIRQGGSSSRVGTNMANSNSQRNQASTPDHRNLHCLGRRCRSATGGMVHIHGGSHCIEPGRSRPETNISPLTLTSNHLGLDPRISGLQVGSIPRVVNTHEELRTINTRDHTSNGHIQTWTWTTSTKLSSVPQGLLCQVICRPYQMTIRLVHGQLSRSPC